MASALSSDVLKHCKHSQLMERSRPNWLVCDWRSHLNSVHTSFSNSQRGLPFLEGTLSTSVGLSADYLQLLSNSLL